MLGEEGGVRQFFLDGGWEGFWRENIQAVCHSLFEPHRPVFTAAVPIKTDRFLQLGSRFRVELHWFAWARHLQFFEGLQRIGPLNFTGINLVYAPLNFVPESRIKTPGFFAFMDGHDELLMESQHVLQRQMLNLLFNLFGDCCHITIRAVGCMRSFFLPTIHHYFNLHSKISPKSWAGYAVLAV